MADTKVVFWQLEPVWGLPNASPFCMKLETWLRMAALPYEARTLTGPPRSSTGKVPYLERADGSLLCDSSSIIEELAAQHGVDLDAELSPGERAQALLLQRTFEEHLYFLVLHERWLEDESWTRVRADYFDGLPLPLRLGLPPLLRRSIRRDARGQGVARLTPEQRLARGRADVEAITTVLGERPYFMGERPTTIDATAYGFIAQSRAPVLGPVGRLVLEQPTLMAYEQRMRERYFA